MGRLLLLFIAIPVIELFLLIEIGQRVGTLTTVGIIIATGLVGASLARQQGMSTLARLRADLAASRLPAEPIVDGVLILVAAAVLITPGLLTDVAGFLCLIPAFRQLVRRYLKQTFERAVREGTIGIPQAFDGAGTSSRRPPMKDVTPRRPGDSGRRGS
ncbi:MAG: membrane protein FxsA [Acidobacteria bacterium]|nr:membrane protein FxsA [Acidobacteriota bacterium]HJN45366.1 FxsA family protein [Vicinamibacterales bacterium]